MKPTSIDNTLKPPDDEPEDAMGIALDADAIETVNGLPKPEDASAEQRSLPFAQVAGPIVHSAFGPQVVQSVRRGLIGFPGLFFAVAGAVADFASLASQNLVLVGLAVALAWSLYEWVRSARLEVGPRQTAGIRRGSFAAIGAAIFGIVFVFQSIVGGSRGAIAGTNDEIASLQSTIFDRLGLIEIGVEEIGKQTERIENTSKQTLEAVRDIDAKFQQLRDEYQPELKAAKRALQASESDLVSLLAYILESPVARDNISSALEKAYKQLKDLRQGIGSLHALAGETPEIAPLLKQADAALSEGAEFSLDVAATALAEARAQYAELISKQYERIKDSKKGLAAILGKEAEIAIVKFDYDLAVRFYRKQLELFIDVYGREHTETANGYDNLARVLDAQGRYRESGPIFTLALRIRQRNLSANHSEIATSYNNTAENLGHQGKYKYAEEFFRKALDIRRKVFGERHADTAQSYDSLAYNLAVQGRYDEAEPLIRKALDIRKSIFSTDHQDIAESYNSLAYNLNAQGRFKEAQLFFLMALRIRQRVLGEVHPETAASYNNIAANMDDQGMYSEAEVLHRKALAARKLVLSERHPDTAASYNNLAVNLNAQGRYSEAEPLFHKALDIRREKLGLIHPDTASSYNNIASNLDAQGKYGHAEEFYRLALAIWQGVLDEGHPVMALIYNNLARNLDNQGKNRESEQFHQRALDLRK